MRVLFIGIYTPTYCRTWSLEHSLQAVGVEVDHCLLPKQSLKRLKPWKDLWRCLRAKRGTYDIILVPYPSDRFVWFAKLFGNAPVIYDQWISTYDTQVFDHKFAASRSLWGWYFWLRDWTTLKLADRIISDTNEHKEYYINEFRISPQKIDRVRYCANRDVFSISAFRGLSRVSGGPFVVSFHGKLVSDITGIDVMFEAASILKDENILFRFIGAGPKAQEYRREAEERGLANVEFVGWVNNADLPKELFNADVVLAAYGLTPKAQRTVPSKVFEASALGKAVIVGDTAPAREIFVEGENCVFAKMGDAKSLAEKILLLKQNPALRDHIGRGALELCDRGPVSLEAIGTTLKETFTKVL